MNVNVTMSRMKFGSSETKAYWHLSFSLASFGVRHAADKVINISFANLWIVLNFPGKLFAI